MSARIIEYLEKLKNNIHDIFSLEYIKNKGFEYDEYEQVWTKKLDNGITILIDNKEPMISVRDAYEIEKIEKELIISEYEGEGIPDELLDVRLMSKGVYDPIDVICCAIKYYWTTQNKKKIKRGEFQGSGHIIFNKDVDDFINKFK